jgi:hypothetical protein
MPAQAALKPVHAAEPRVAFQPAAPRFHFARSSRVGFPFHQVIPGRVCCLLPAPISPGHPGLLLLLAPSGCFCCLHLQPAAPRFHFARSSRVGSASPGSAWVGSACARSSRVGPACLLRVLREFLLGRACWFPFRSNFRGIPRRVYWLSLGSVRSARDGSARSARHGSAAGRPGPRHKVTCYDSIE